MKQFWNRPVPALCLCLILAVTLFNQGGYFAGGVVLGGLLVSLLLSKAKPRLSLADGAFLLFALWYLFCTLLPGFDIDYTARGLLPLIGFGFYLLLGEDRENSKKLLHLLFWLGALLAVISLWKCADLSFASGRLRRSIYPFQYANASGIFFGVLFFLARHSGEKRFSRLSYLFLGALLVTQSVGAIALTVLAELLCYRSLRKTLIVCALLAVAAFVMKDRVLQSAGTFVERLLHIYDGLSCMLQNPLFGIGAGRWAVHKPLYQSGFYATSEIHSSITAIGASSGVVGLILFLGAVACVVRKVRFENKAHAAGLLMLLIHSLLDFSFAFLGIGLLAAVILAQGEITPTRSLPFPLAVRGVLSAFCVLGCLVLAVGLNQIKVFERQVAAKDYVGAVETYREDLLLQHSFEATEGYVKALRLCGATKACLAALDEIDVLSSEMTVIQMHCEDNWRVVVDTLKAQPYNHSLYKALDYCNDEALLAEAEEQREDAIASLSFLGKQLYQIEGDSQ